MADRAKLLLRLNEIKILFQISFPIFSSNGWIYQYGYFSKVSWQRVTPYIPVLILFSKDDNRQAGRQHDKLYQRGLRIKDDDGWRLIMIKGIGRGCGLDMDMDIWSSLNFNQCHFSCRTLFKESTRR